MASISWKRYLLDLARKPLKHQLMARWEHNTIRLGYSLGVNLDADDSCLKIIYRPLSILLWKEMGKTLNARYLFFLSMQEKKASKAGAPILHHRITNSTIIRTLVASASSSWLVKAKYESVAVFEMGSFATKQIRSKFSWNDLIPSSSEGNYRNFLSLR